MTCALSEVWLGSSVERDVVTGSVSRRTLMHGSAADGASTCATDAASRSLSVPAAAAAGTGPLPFDASVVSATSPDV